MVSVLNQPLMVIESLFNKVISQESISVKKNIINNKSWFIDNGL